MTRGFTSRLPLACFISMPHFLTTCISFSVTLAPAGLNAALTGQSLPSTDARAARILKEWEKFYPVVTDERSNSFIPCLVEIILGESKMLYPSCLVGVPVPRQGKFLYELDSLMVSY